MHMRSFMLTAAAVAVLTATSVGHIQTTYAADPSPVSNDVGTKKQAHSNNRALGRAVRQSFWHVKGLDASRVNVVARGDTITLAGSAPDQFRIQSAGAATSKVAGVGRADNRLTVSEPGH